MYLSSSKQVIALSVNYVKEKYDTLKYNVMYLFSVLDILLFARKKQLTRLFSRMDYLHCKMMISNCTNTLEIEIVECYSSS